jgi:hypothetical protein
MRYELSRVIAGKGAGPGQFVEALRGIAVGGEGLVYAVGDCALKVFDSTGRLQRQHRTGRASACVAVDSDGSVYVGQAHQIERFDDGGKLSATWQDEKQLGLVTEIGLYQESVLVGDATNRCIHRYDRDGKFLNDIGKSNNTGGFVIPNGHLDFQIDREGIIHVAHSGKHRVERYSMAGELLGSFGKFGGQEPQEFAGCCNPTNVALTGKGQVVVTEKAPPRAKVYDSAGSLLVVIDSGTFDPLCKNMDVATDGQGRVYVVDTVRLQICVFAAAVNDGKSGSLGTDGGGRQ